MPTFKVTCYDDGLWDGKEAREIEAVSEQAAAEAACGEPLMSGAKLGDLRAAVHSIVPKRSPKTFRRPPGPVSR